MVFDDATAGIKKYISSNTMQKNKPNTEIDSSWFTFPNASWLVWVGELTAIIGWLILKSRTLFLHLIDKRHEIERVPIESFEEQSWTNGVGRVSATLASSIEISKYFIRGWFDMMVECLSACSSQLEWFDVAFGRGCVAREALSCWNCYTLLPRCNAVELALFCFISATCKTYM